MHLPRKTITYLFLPLVCFSVLFLLNCENATVCSTDTQCTSGWYCDKNVCVPNCQTDNVCAEGNTCQSGRCVAKTTPDASQEATPEEATSEEATSEEATSEEATSEEATSEEVTSEEVTPEPPPQESCVPSQELCNNFDDDCDGKIDEGVTRTCYTGSAGTAGQGNCKEGTQACNNGQWETTCVGEILPTAETCNNQDDDCDGKIDEELSRSCYTGPQDTSGKGACKDGLQFCARGQWETTCVGEVLPTAETCNNQDDDCNGSIDEGVTRSCYTGPTGTAGQGSCKNGVESCNNGQWDTNCVGEVLPGTETCNNQDDDCDGKIDEGVTRTCYTGPQGTAGQGRCKEGAQACNAGQWSTACTGQILPATETCNNMDDDCDGQIDEGLTRSCYTGPTGTAGRGQCRNGTQACNAGQWPTACTGEVLPGTETCNNQDDDCDGRIDEGLTRSCYTGPTGTAGRGSCRNGTQACNAGQWSATCTGQILPATETCNNIDDDCDGQIDEGVTRSCYTGPTGTAGRGQCRNGTQACNAGQWSATCTGQILPSTELCSTNVDEDCDGQVGNAGASCCGVSGGYLYCWFRTRMTWTNARNACQTWGGHLAGVENAQQNTYIANISNGSTWLGGTYNHTSTSGTWLSGKTWSYTNWATQFGEPNNTGGNEIHVEINAYNIKGLWNDAAPTATFSYVCERPVTNCTSNAQCPTATPRCDPAGFCVK